MSTRRKAIIFGLVFLTLAISAVAWIWDTEVIGNSEMNFYGRVVDSGNNGMANVSVEFQVAKGDFFSLVYLWHGPSTEIDKIQTQTDQNGNFELHYWGTDINILDFHTPGYRFGDAGPVVRTPLPETQFMYSRSTPGRMLPSDPAHRITYPLQKVLPGELP
ncbi:MAG: hypothetical protein M3O30_18840 [Planctomycetota bacterium]|nr:hypothetical protein [Planctomycetota bacterium]